MRKNNLPAIFGYQEILFLGLIFFMFLPGCRSEKDNDTPYDDLGKAESRFTETPANGPTFHCLSYGTKEFSNARGRAAPKPDSEHKPLCLEFSGAFSRYSGAFCPSIDAPGGRVSSLTPGSCPEKPEAIHSSCTWKKGDSSLKVLRPHKALSHPTIMYEICSIKIFNEYGLFKQN